ncbi:hypothetical protein BDV97DRAFT_400118 [Delphinella strobiligena]|nr:hypothetical protein BDV97DRAFT_400118 [Delphinella strobiligena]
MSRRSGAPSHSQQSGDQKSRDIGSDIAAPPAYTAVFNASIPVTCNLQADDPYAFLSTFDTVFLIDDSGSMAGRSWRETRDALETIIPVCVQHDTDGIDINFLNARDSPYHHNITSSATVREIFSSVQPRGSTPTGQRLSAILKPYLRSCEANLDAVKPLNLIVITDGVPTDDVESALILAAKKLDKLEAPAWQIGVQFFQVGNDEGARQHLKQLDDELSDIAGGEIRDMVDTVPFISNDGGALTGEGILKVVLGAVNRRLDRKKSKDLHR